ncbi:hypothetical protein LY76DRAFT_638853 [Colletotrichum caudatum]|nr:hypothetical protein LY76DRAFT_638853 [Colletotrichum caudatum]
MEWGVVAHKRSVEGRAKVKTGCKTCRIRKVKCDERKPLCHKCVNTGRNCDGYESPFIFHTGQSYQKPHVGGLQPHAALRTVRPAMVEIDPRDICRLNRYFSTKTMLGVELACDEEAGQILHASLTSPPVRHAVSSLGALRQDLEVSGDGPASAAQQTPGRRYGLQQYNMALRGLASNLSCPGPHGPRSALLCCQIFISIEQVRKNYAAMAQHIVRGLRIMRECGARPRFVAAANDLAPACHDRLPLLDVFIIKLFAAPCKFADAPPAADRSGTTLSVCPIPPRRQPIGPSGLRPIAPDMRTRLVSIATSTLEFLSKLAQVDTVAGALRLLPRRTSLLDSLELWLLDLELTQTKTGRPGHELLSVSFLRLFHLILKIVLLGALDSSPGIDDALQIESDRLQALSEHRTDQAINQRPGLCGNRPPPPAIVVCSGILKEVYLTLYLKGYTGQRQLLEFLFLSLTATLPYLINRKNRR